MSILRNISVRLAPGEPRQSGNDVSGAGWIRYPRFEPVEGKCFELAFGRIPAQPNENWEVRRVRIDGPTVEEWIDLDSGRPLERALYAYAIKAYRPLDDDRAPVLH